MPAVSLTDLQQQIAQREQELQALREQLQSQKSHLAELTRRKEQLQSELQQVEEEIASLATTEARTTEPAASAAPTKSEKTPARPEPSAKSSGKRSSPATAGKSAKPGRRGGQTPLRVVLTAVLKKSHKPLSGSELAKRALKAGYQTTSAQFVDSVWAMLSQMDNVEHLPQQGYRLKKK